MDADQALRILEVIKREEKLSEIMLESLSYLERAILNMAVYLNQDIRLNVKHHGSLDYMKYEVIDHFAGLE